MNRSFRTPKGTDLPILLLKGKEYLQVQQRIVWFREERPDWSIETDFIQLTPDIAVAKATIKNESGRIVAMGTKSETPKGFPDYIEKAETGAIGRAVALCGFGTQFCADELDEGARVVDSPIAIVHPQTTETKFLSQTQDGMLDWSEYVVKFGAKYKGKKLKDIGFTDATAYLNWMESDCSKKGTPLSNDAQGFKTALERWGESVRPKQAAK